MINKSLALVLSLLAANPAVALAPATALLRYVDPEPNVSYGRAVAVYESGDVLFVGQITSIGPVIVRMNPALGVTRWRKVLAGYTGMVPYCAATSGETAFVGGNDGGTGRVIAVDAAGNVSASFSDGTVGAGFRAIATDPVDGTLWTVGWVQLAPERARLVHLSAGAVAITTDDYQMNGQPTHSAAVAVTRERVYVGGQSYIGPTYRPWIMARTRTSPVAIFNVLHPSLNSGWVISLSAVGEDVYSVVNHDASPSYQNSFLFRNDFTTGQFSATTTLALSANQIAGGGEFIGGVVRHPSLPVVIAATAGGFRCFKPDLTEIASAAGTFNASGMFTPASLAVSSQLEFSVYGACSVQQSAFWRFHGTGVRMSSPFDELKPESKLIIAPNHLDLTKTAARIRFVVQLDTVPAEGELKVYDLAGHLVIGLPFTVSDGKTADVLWDGKREDGTRIGTGGYLAVVDGDGFKAGTDRALFVITGAAK